MLIHAAPAKNMKTVLTVLLVHGYCTIAEFHCRASEPCAVQSSGPNLLQAKQITSRLTSEESCPKTFDGGCGNWDEKTLDLNYDNISTVGDCFHLCQATANCGGFFLSVNGPSCLLVKQGCINGGGQKFVYYAMETCYTALEGDVVIGDYVVSKIDFTYGEHKISIGDRGVVAGHGRGAGEDMDKRVEIDFGSSQNVNLLPSQFEKAEAPLSHKATSNGSSVAHLYDYTCDKGDSPDANGCCSGTCPSSCSSKTVSISKGVTTCVCSRCTLPDSHTEPPGYCCDDGSSPGSNGCCNGQCPSTCNSASMAHINGAATCTCNDCHGPASCLSNSVTQAANAIFDYNCDNGSNPDIHGCCGDSCPTSCSSEVISMNSGVKICSCSRCSQPGNDDEPPAYCCDDGSPPESNGCCSGSCPSACLASSISSVDGISSCTCNECSGPKICENASAPCVDVQPPSDWANPTCESQVANTEDCAKRRAGEKNDGYCAKTCGLCGKAEGPAPTPSATACTPQEYVAYNFAKVVRPFAEGTFVDKNGNWEDEAIKTIMGKCQPALNKLEEAMTAKDWVSNSYKTYVKPCKANATVCINSKRPQNDCKSFLGEAVLNDYLGCLGSFSQ